MRAEVEEKEFAEFFLKIGDGTYPHEESMIQPPASIISNDIIGDICREEFKSFDEIRRFSKSCYSSSKK